MRGTKARTAGAKRRRAIWEGAVFTLFKTFITLRVCFFSRPGGFFRPAAETHPAHFQPFPSAPRRAVPARAPPFSPQPKTFQLPANSSSSQGRKAFPAPAAPTSAPREGAVAACLYGGMKTGGAHGGTGKKEGRGREVTFRTAKPYVLPPETIPFARQNVCSRKARTRLAGARGHTRALPSLPPYSAARVVKVAVATGVVTPPS